VANNELVMDEELFENLMQKPYRAWIDHYLTTMDPPEMDQELDAFIGALPDTVYEAMPSFMDAATKFLVGQPRSWDLTGSKVATIIAALADEKIPAVANFSGDEQDSLYGAFFDVVTLFFSVRSAESEELRQIMGI
jgi:hypothetical protein